MNDIKPGFRFTNNGMDLTMICFTSKKDTNLGLAVNSNEGLFITFRNLQQWKGGYTWDWGHYFSDVYDALIDYDARKKEL